MRTVLGIPLLLAGCYAQVQLSGGEAEGPPIRFTDGVVPENLLILSVDTTRRDHLGRFSGSRLTPNLDAFLDGSVLLADHHSCSNWTAPSMTCVVSGRTQMEQNFATWNGDGGAISEMPGEDFVDDTLATGMSGRGKQTLLITANQVFGPWSTGVAVGYDAAIDVDYQQAEAVVGTAMVEIPALVASGLPWYAHVHFMDPHGPYCAPDAYVDLDVVAPSGLSTGEWCADSYGVGGGWYVMSPEVQEASIATHLALYDAELAYWDTWFGDLWDQLEAAGALDHTLVVFVTDHGQQFFERGGHGHGLYLGPEENRSTAAFWAKNLAPREWTEPTIHQDVNATLNHVFEIPVLHERSGYVVGEAPDRALRILNYWGGGSSMELGVIRDQQQLNYRFDGAREFYRYDDDPQGLNDVYDPADPDVIARWDDMSAWVDTVVDQWPSLAAPVDPGP